MVPSRRREPAQREVIHPKQLLTAAHRWRGFDTDLDFSGTVQLAFTRQYATRLELDSNGLEWNNSKVNPANLPVINARFSNMTVWRHTGLGQPRYSAVLRRGSG